MSVKTTFSNGRTMAAGFYDGLRLTNRQAQIVEMMRNERTKTEIAASLGIQEKTVAVTLCNAAVANGITVPQLRERCNIAPVRVGRKPHDVDFDAKRNMSEGDRLRRELSTIEGRWRKGQINTVEARTQAARVREQLRKTRAGKAMRDAEIPGTRKGWTLTQDQATLQLALRFNGDIHNAAKWLDWTEKECLTHIVDACKLQNVQPTLENFLSIM